MQATSAPAVPASLVVDALVEDGLIDTSERERALSVVAHVLAPAPGRPPSRGGVSSLVEIVAYLGTALVLAAGGLFLGQIWGELGFGTRLGLLGLLAVSLAAAGLAAVAGHREAVLVRDPAHDARRRLAGILLTGAALALALAVGMVVDRLGGTAAYDDTGVDWTWVAASGAGLVAAAAGYRIAASAVGLLGIADALSTLVSVLAEPLDASTGGVVLGTALLVTALGWLAVTERGWFAEVTLARGLGVLLALWAAQTPVVLGEVAWFGYLLTAVLAVAGTLAYLRCAAWPYLAIAVVAVTVVVPEAILDWTAGGLGAVGAVLLTGLTLLAASLLGARLHAARGSTPTG